MSGDSESQETWVAVLRDDVHSNANDSISVVLKSLLI